MIWIKISGKKGISAEMKKTFLICLTSILFFSCSLKYGETVNVEESTPEFVFQDTKITRYEDKKISVEIEAGILEQYKDTSETFAKDIIFTAYDNEGEPKTEGNCGYLFTDTEEEIYELYDNIQLLNHDDKTKFFADVLKWDAKNEQLTSGRGNNVRIETDDTVMVGSGFSASGLSKTFVFTGSVTGDIETK